MFRSNYAAKIALVLAGFPFACSSDGGSADDGAAQTGSSVDMGGVPGAEMPVGSVGDPAPGVAPNPAAAPPATPDVEGDLIVPDEAPMPAATIEVTEGTACAGLELAPEVVEVEVPVEITTTMEVLQPVALYVILDNSGSMNVVPGETTGNNQAETDDPLSKWNQAVSALTDFVNDPSSEGIDVAIQYFNDAASQQGGGFGGNDDDEADTAGCDGTNHAQPDVEMGRLPGNAEAFAASLIDAAPRGTTPTVGALAGGVQFCTEFQAQNPDEKCAVIIVTDGLPNGCGLSDQCEDEDADIMELCVDPEAMTTLTPLAEQGATAGVLTFTVGMNGITAEGFDLLNAIAVAGGTDCTPDAAGAEACDVSTTGAAGLLAAMAAIRDSITVTETVTETMTVTETQALACSWGIPPVPEGETFDPALVNVTLAVDGGLAETIGGVGTEAACAASGGLGWYYDDPANPTTITACPASCTLIETALNPAVNVLLGCATQPPPGAR